jgi:hypothetical protein
VKLTIEFLQKRKWAAGGCPWPETDLEDLLSYRADKRSGKRAMRKAIRVRFDQMIDMTPLLSKIGRALLPRLAYSTIGFID